MMVPGARAELASDGPARAHIGRFDVRQISEPAPDRRMKDAVVGDDECARVARERDQNEKSGDERLETSALRHLAGHSHQASLCRAADNDPLRQPDSPSCAADAT